MYFLALTAIVAVCGIFGVSKSKSRVMFNDNVEALTEDEVMYFSYAVSHKRNPRSDQNWYVEPTTPNPEIETQWCEEAPSKKKDSMCIFAVHWN